jgi:hypothetical protein
MLLWHVSKYGVVVVVEAKGKITDMLLLEAEAAHITK